MNTTSSRCLFALVALAVLATMSHAQSMEGPFNAHKDSYSDSYELPYGRNHIRFIPTPVGGRIEMTPDSDDNDNLMVSQQAKGQRGIQACRGTGSCTATNSGQGYNSCSGDGSCTAPNSGSGANACSGIGSCTAQGSGRGRNSCSGTGSCTGVNSGRCAGSCTRAGSCTTANSCS